ncbi:hypothetical protein LSAT2_000094, partial [Lamellibrachia satsuma]
MKHLKNAKRVGAWDAYFTSSIKQSTREKRGNGIRGNVAGKHKVSGNGKDFLRNTDNKLELFVFFSSTIATLDCPDGKEVFATSGKFVVVRGTHYRILLCDHQEAD